MLERLMQFQEQNYTTSSEIKAFKNKIFNIDVDFFLNTHIEDVRY